VIFKPVKPYLIWILLIILLGPSVLLTLRGTSNLDAQVAIAEAFDQLNHARMYLSEQYMFSGKWPEALDEVQYNNPVTELYIVKPDVLGLVFKDDLLIRDTLGGTRIEMVFNQNTERWACRPGKPSPPKQFLPINCGGRTQGWWGDLPLLIVICMAIVFGRFFVTHVLNNPGLKQIRKDPAAIKSLPLASLGRLHIILKLTRRLTATLVSAKVNRHVWQQAVRFSQQSPDQQIRILAQRFKADSQKITGEQAQGVVYNWTIADDSILMLNRCKVFYPAAHCQGQLLWDTLSKLSQGSAGLLVIVLDEAENQSLQDLAGDRKNPIVVPGTEELTTMLLAFEPEPSLNRVLARQLTLARISPYQTRGGLTRASRFFGRERELAKILDRDLNNYLLIGGRQLGKTSLLKELERRYQHQPDIRTYYLSLRDHRLTARLAMVAEMEATSSLSEIMLALSRNQQGQRLLIMVDEADLFMRFERDHDYPTLQEIRSISDEGLGYFIFAGFWDLYESALYDYQSPIRNFGETIRIGALDYNACREMVVRPISLLGLSFVSEELVDEIIRGTGRRANLIAIACQQCIEAMQPDDHQISRDIVQRALNAEAIAEALSGWGRLTANARASRIDRVIIYKGITGGAVDLGTILRLFDSTEFTVEADDVQQALMRLQLAFILRKSDVGYSFAVPLFRRQLTGEDIELLLNQELDGLRQQTDAVDKS